MQLDGSNPKRFPLDHAEDRRLVDRLVQGDSPAWQRFLDTYVRLIRTRVADVARSFGYPSEGVAIDDATADVFSSLVANDSAALRAYAGRSSLVTYLAVIATRCSTRHFARQRWLTRHRSDLPLEEAIANSTSDPAAPLEQDETRQRVQALMAELPEKQRDVVRLFHLEGQSYATISQVLGMPIGSVGVTLRRAEAKLRERIEPPQE